MELSILLRRPVGAEHSLILHRRISVGRGPENDIVIPNPHVSWTHAVLWREGDRAMVEDLNTRNGTFVGGRPVVERSDWAVGEVVHIGDTQLILQRDSQRTHPQRTRTMAVEDVETGVRYPLRQTHFAVGDVPNAAIRIPGARVVLISRPNGEVWLAEGADDRPLTEGEVFTVGSVRLRLIPSEHGWSPTMGDDDAHPYLVEAALLGQSGPRAHIVDMETGREVTVTAPNRVALLYFLAQANLDDRERRVVATERGWRADDAAGIAVWGREARAADPRRLKTLIHNLRTELREGGLDPWCVEKRRGGIRLRATKLALE